MKNQIASLEKSTQNNQDKKRKQKFEQLNNTKVQGLSKSFVQGERNAIAVVNLDLGGNQKEVIKVYQDDDIHQVVLNFCLNHELEERCIDHMFEIITQQINSAKSKESLNHTQQQQKQFSIQEQQQSVQSSEKEEIQSQTTNTSSKQNLFQLNTFSPGQAYGLKDPFQSTLSSQSFKKEKLLQIKNGIVCNQREDFYEGELDFEHDGEYNLQESQRQCKGFQQRSLNRTLTSQMENEIQKKRNENSDKQVERNKSRNASKSHHEGDSSLLKNSFVGSTEQSVNSKKSSFIKNEELKQHVMENYDKWHKLIGMKKYLNVKSREDSKFIENGNNLSNTILHDEKRSRSQSQKISPNQQLTKLNTSRNDKNSKDRKLVEKNFIQLENQSSDDDCNIDEYQIQEIIRNEGQIPNTLTKSQQKMAITKSKARVSPKRRTPFLTSCSSGQPSSSSQSSCTETKLNKITQQLSNIEEVQNSSISNTSRLENSQFNSSIISSYPCTQQNLSGSIIQNNPHNNLNRNEDLSKKNNNIQKTPTRNPKNQAKEISPLSGRNNSKLNNSQIQQKQINHGQQSLQKRVQGMIPLLDIKKVQNNSEFYSKQYSQTSRSPTALSHRQTIVNHDDFQKYLKGNQTERDNNQRQNLSSTNKVKEKTSVINQISIQNQQQVKQKPLIAERKKQQSEHHQQQNSNIISKQNQIQYQKESNQNIQNVKQQDSFISMNHDNSFMIQSQHNNYPQSENNQKDNLELYKKQKKILTNTPLTDRSDKRDEYFEGRQSQTRGQQDKRLQVNQKQSKGFNQRNSPLHSRSINLGNDIKSPIRNNISEISEHDKNNKLQQTCILENNFFEEQNNLNKPSSPPTSIQNILNKDKKNIHNKGVFIITGTKQINDQQGIIKNQQTEEVKQNELLVNRLLRQKEIPKVNQNIPNNSQQPAQQKEIAKKLDSNLNRQQQFQSNINQVDSNYNQDKFTQFLHEKIFDQMDSDQDGYISVMDVDINFLNTDVLAVLQNFLIQLADNSSLQYSSSEFIDFVYSNKQIHEELKQIFIKENSMSNNLKQTPQIQKVQKQQQIYEQEQPIQQQSNKPSQSKQQQQLLHNESIGYQHQQPIQQLQQQQKQLQSKQQPQIHLQQQQYMLQQQQQLLYKQQQEQLLLQQQQQQQLLYQQQQQILQLQQQLEQESKQKQQKISNSHEFGQQQSQFIEQQVKQPQIAQKQQQNQTINNQQVKNNTIHEIVQQQPIINQSSIQSQNQLQQVLQNTQLKNKQNPQPYQAKQQNLIPQNEQQQQPFIKKSEVNIQSNQPVIQHQFSFQPQYIISDDEDDQGEEAPIQHFVDLSKRISNKKQDNSQQQQLIKQLKNNSKNDNAVSFGNFSSSASIQQNEQVNFSFSEDIINRSSKQSNTDKNNNPPYLHNIQPKDINSSSQNHSPSFHEQKHTQNVFGVQNSIQDNQNENEQIGQDLLVSFSNQSFVNRESFGSNNNPCLQFSPQKGDPIDIDQFEIISSSPPQISSGRYKNLVQKQFNHPSSSHQN